MLDREKHGDVTDLVIHEDEMLSISGNIEIDTDIDFDVGDFLLVNEDEKTRIMQPKMARSAVYQSVDYKRAEDMAQKISLEKGSRTTVIVPGNFIFGDLLEALIIGRGIDADELVISTLSISQDNVDSLKTIMLARPSMKLSMVVSGYFYSHYKYDLVPYIYRELDMDDRFQIAFTNTHMKIALISSRKGTRYTLTGSANMRSSSSLEQFDMDEGMERYEFFHSALMALVDKYRTIDYTVPKIGRGLQSWQVVQQSAAGEGHPP